MPTAPLERLALALLLAGVCAFVILDLCGKDEPSPAQGYEIAGETAYPVDPTDSKAFLANLERYQGKTGIMLYELRLWWGGLWRGRALGRTLLALSALTAGALVAWSRWFPPPDRPDQPPGPGTPTP
ncbi:hypothetical protein JCM15519_28770 [Fundidesulfovibrio butyratiphilus]